MGRSEVHSHPHTDELFVLFVPADETKPVEFKTIANEWQAMTRLVDGYIEVVHHTVTLESIPDCGCMMSMVVNEDGLSQSGPINPRASSVHPSSPIVGDVFFVAEGLVNRDDETEIDFVSLPPYFKTWQGPGHEYPKPSLAWMVDPENGS